MPACDQVDYDRIRSYVKKRVRRLTSTLGFTASDLEDIEQEVIVSIHQQLSRYDSERGLFEAFINMVVTSTIRNLIEQRKTQKRRLSFLSCSLDDPIIGEDGERMAYHEACDAQACRGSWVDPESYTCDQLDFKADIDRFIERLPPRLALVCRVLKQMNISDAAQELGIERTEMYRRIRRIRELFEQWMVES